MRWEDYKSDLKERKVKDLKYKLKYTKKTVNKKSLLKELNFWNKVK